VSGGQVVIGMNLISWWPLPYAVWVPRAHSWWEPHRPISAISRRPAAFRSCPLLPAAARSASSCPEIL